MERFRKWSWILAIVLVICLVIYVFPWRHKIDITVRGIQCRIGDADYSEDVLITVKGVYKQYLIKNDTFEGTISIDIYDFTLDMPMTPALFYDGYANLIYLNIQDGVPNMRTFGLLSCTPNFDKMLIGVSEPLEAESKCWSGENGLFICAPAQNRAQALESAKILSSKSKLLSHTNWD